MFRRTFPKVKFRLNKALDKEICFAFLKHKKGGLDFGRGIIKVHPSLTSVKKFPVDKQKQAIEQYTDQFYRVHQNQLRKAKQNFQKEWDKKAADFFKEVDKIFDRHPWPKGPYFGYISIFPCGPRFLEEKSFQVFYLRHPRVRPVSHEILHFLFYDYIEKSFPEEDSSSEAIWILSEITNSLVLDSPQFRKIIGVLHLHAYPAQKRLLSRLKPLWQRDNLRSFLKKSLPLVKTR
ncbi:hypothetical protein KKI19_03785 [Patescibacteria group bacterium]|nr:hypothetical protein [Patescibacteria group bacterium]